MERCFIKYESQAFFGSFFKSHPEGQSLFCDYYNPQTKMYCKRLKSMCPEHEKEKKVIGFFLNLFSQRSNYLLIISHILAILAISLATIYSLSFI
jgi:hypothetical protein